MLFRYVVQKYIERPLLVGGRKFDIRVFVLAVSDRRSGRLRAFVHRDGYVRTSSNLYSMSEASLKNPAVHLTNDGNSRLFDGRKGLVCIKSFVSECVCVC